MTEQTNKPGWSPQQRAFLSWCMNGVGSCILEAVAGAGKTTTILAAAQHMPGQVAILAYSTKITREIKDKLATKKIDYKKAQAGTVHSFGWSALRKSFPNIGGPDGEKVRAIVEEMVAPRGNEPPHRMNEYIREISKLVSFAKQRAFGIGSNPDIEDRASWRVLVEHFEVFDPEVTPEDVIEEAIGVAIKALNQSNGRTDVADFDDMVYLPVLLHCRFWQFDVVMIDEAQDTNPARRELVKALVRRGGRVIAVGDRHQAIYGFTGADNDSLDQIKRDFGAREMPLTVSYRCPQEVIKFAKRWVSHIEAAPEAPQGEVLEMEFKDFIAQAPTLTGSDAILCRNTRPLVALAFRLIRLRVPARIEGREIGNGLAKLAQRWKVQTTAQLSSRLDQYLASETKKLAQKQEAKLAQVEDMVETLRVVIDQCNAEGKRSIDDVVTLIRSLFADTDGQSNIVTLSTIHKSKGREWERVFWLDRVNTCPSRRAKQPWELEQEDNLCYVAATRAKATLIDLAGDPEAAAAAARRKAKAA